MIFRSLSEIFSIPKVSPIFGHHLVVLLLIVHLLVGFRRLREIDYYRDDPLVLRLLGLRKLPDVSTVSRAFSQMEGDDVENHRALSRDLVTEGLIRERFPRLTLDWEYYLILTNYLQRAAVLLACFEKLHFYSFSLLQPLFYQKFRCI